MPGPRPTAWLLTLVVAMGAVAMAVVAGQAGASETEAEAAARTQRALTQAEVDRLTRDCPLPEPAADSADQPDLPNARTVSLPETVFLPLLVYRQVQTDGRRDAKISRFGDLPYGGVGLRDFCESVSLVRFPPYGRNGVMSVLALRLRPGLDLAADYPTAFAEMRKRSQLARIEAGRYARIAIEDKSVLDEISTRPNAFGGIDRSRIALQTKSAVYLPLKD